jgi:acyl dehydratase
MIDYAAVKNWSFDEVPYHYTERDTMLYALAIGLGRDPLDARELRYIYEADLHAMPTMATLMGAPGPWWKDPRTGADATKLVHGEQRLRLLRPLPVKGLLLARNRVVSLTDKGAGKGAVGVVTRDIIDPSSGDIVAQGTNVSMLRSDGGFSQVSGVSDPPPVPLPGVPDRAADLSVDLPSLPQSALIYRLTGDLNPLHADPDVAARAGFERPILHGLCTYGMACHAVMRACLNYDAGRLRALSVRFTAPVFPGDTVRFDLWREAAGRELRLRARVEARSVVVLDNGVIEVD